jgi:hypothetical protein
MQREVYMGRSADPSIIRQVDPSRYRVAIAEPSQQAPYRASGFVH